MDLRALLRNSSWLLLLPPLAGCSDFPVLAGLSPWTRREWADDEKYAQTFHAKVRDIQELAAEAAAAPAGDKERYAKTFADRLQTENNGVLRQQLVVALGTCEGPLAAEALRVFTADPDASVRIAACGALGRFKAAEAAQVLANVVGSDKELDVRLAAARELANFPNNAEAIRALGTLLDDANPAAQYRAVQSLKQVTKRELGDNVAAWREFVQSGDAFAPRAPQNVVERVKNWF